MRVKLEENYKDLYTVTELEQAKKVIAYEKEDESKPEEWLTYAANVLTNHKTSAAIGEIITAKAETVKNNRVWEAFGNETGHMDIWISGLVEIWTEEGWGYLKIGACLSDIWQTGATDYFDQIYYQYFRKADLF